jgi:class 3 adenylate cyclase
MSQVVDPSLAARAQSALDKHAWQEAFDLLSEADATGTDLSPEELDLLADASWWVGKLPAAIDARERAYAAHLKEGNQVMAMVAAIQIGRDNLLRNSHSIGNAWLNRAERLLETMDENPGHGWLVVTRAFQAGLRGDYEEAHAQSTRARDIAQRLGDGELDTLALSVEGLSLIYQGRVEEGMAMLDEATVPAVSGELPPQTAGSVCCSTIGACAGLGDWVRAAQWTEAQDRWCQREHINGFPGMCRLYRAEIKRFHGDWLGAEAEARRASEELQGFIPAAAGLAFYEIGVIKLRRGDLPAAEDALTRGHSFGRDPEPALSLLRLAQGKVDAAAASIRRAIDEPPETPSWFATPGSEMNRLWLLPAQAEIALAVGDLETARAAAEELAELAKRFESVATRANAATWQGAVLVADGDHAGAAKPLRQAVQLWSELDAPYEGAKARMLLAQAYAAESDLDRAALELDAAKAGFERLGAIPDLRRAEGALAALQREEGAPSLRQATDRAARAFVFTDIVDSTKLAELVGDEAWDKLIRWHDQTLRSLVAEHGGEEIKGTGDGFFLAFKDPDSAVECAIAIQRRLDEQRHAQGFAPAVRIGVHWAEATRTGLDYFGTGVNLAARVGAHAGGGEIAVSATTMERSRRTFTELGRQTVELKGISEPVEVVSIDWK